MFKHHDSFKSHALVTAVCAALMVLPGCVQKDSQQAEATSAKENNNKAVPEYWPEISSAISKDNKVEAKVQALLDVMTVEQKVAQMIQPEIRDITVEDMRRYGFGSYLNGGGAFPNNDKHATPADWIALAEDMYQASMDDSLDGIAIPTMWGTDAVHGHNNVIGATIFPHNIGLGAARNPELIQRIAEVTAVEVKVTGIDWIFAPTVAVVRDDRWGRTYEGYSEDPEIVKSYAAAIVKGLQGTPDNGVLTDRHVISTVKHFLGDGGTEGGDDQGNNLASERALFDIHAQGYVGGLTAGAQSVMTSFNSWHGEKIHGNQYLLTQVLKQRMGFDGFVVGDWNGHGQIPGCTNQSCAQAVNAGLDIFMVPTDAWKPLLENTLLQIANGEISMERVNDAVARILRVKLRAGLFDNPNPANRPYSGRTELIGAKEHREVARQAVRESLVLLKNDGVLPLSPSARILVAGDAADNIGKQSGGWTITWQGTGNTNADFPGGTSILDGIKQQVEAADGQIEFNVEGKYVTKPDVAIVVFGEEPYAEGNGDLDNLEYQRGNKKDLALLQSLRQQDIPVVSLFISGRPMWVNPELNASNAFVAAWLPGSEGKAIAPVLFRDRAGKIQHDFTGKLSFSWPKTPQQTTVNRFDQDYAPLLPYGFGLTYADANVLENTLSEETGAADTMARALPLLDGQVQEPWRLRVLSEGQSVEMNSNTLQTDLISVRTADRFVQEDSRRVTFFGKNKTSVALQSDFPQDLRGFIEQGAALNLDLKWLTEPMSDTSLAMLCGENCAAYVQLEPTLFTGDNASNWQTLSVDLACFVNAGATPERIFTAFMLQSAQQGQIEISNINIGQPMPKTIRMECR